MSHLYFDKLNYSLSNEDTTLEQTLLPEKCPHVVSIAGSGSRILPLFVKQPCKMTICDFSKAQLTLTKIRIETVRHFDHAKFCSFWGYPHGHELSLEEKNEMLKIMVLDDEERAFTKELLATSQTTPIIYQGAFEKMLQKLSVIIQFALGKNIINELAAIDDQMTFQLYLEKKFPWFKWKLLIFLLGNSTLLNALLYKGQHPKKNISESYIAYYDKMFKKLFSLLTPRESFFLQMLFFGKIIDMQGAPIETDAHLYKQMQQGIQNSNISYLQGDLLNNIQKMHEPIHFLSFSDIPSYFSSEIENKYLQMIKSKLVNGGLTVHRYYLRKPSMLDISGFADLTSDFQDLIGREKTQIYSIEILRKNE